MSDAYDVVVVGAGTGGYSCALRAAQLDRGVALVERDEADAEAFEGGVVLHPHIPPHPGCPTACE